MQRTTSKKQLGHDEFAYKVKYVESCAQVERKAVLYRLLNELSGNPGLLDTGPVFFESMKLYWDGSSWVIELEGKD